MIRKRALIIEDNENNRYLSTFLLEAHGWEVTVADTGMRGIALAGEVLPAVVLLDIQLPEMDGYAVARAFRSDPLLAPIPIVAVTSFAMPGDRSAALAAGCCGYIEKPIDPATFVATVESHFVASVQE